MSIEDPRLSSIDNTSAADDFDSAVEQHLGYASETVGGIEVAQAETPDATRTDRLPAQTPPVEVAAATIPTEVKPNEQNVVTLPAGIELDNLEFEVDGENLVLVLADGTEIVVLGGAANIPTFVIGDVELPQVALFAALEGSNINVAAGPDGSFSAQGTPSASRNFNDDPIDAGPEDLALANLLGDTAFGDELRTGVVLGEEGDTEPTFLGADAGGVDEDYLKGGNINDGQTGGASSFTGSLGIDWGSDDDNLDGNTGLSNPFDRGVAFTQATLNALISEGYTSDGVELQYELSADGTTIIAYKLVVKGGDLEVSDEAPGDSAEQPLVSREDVFEVSVSDAANGSYTFTLKGNLDHPDGSTEDDITIEFPFTAQDSDGDQASSSFTVTVNDDSPVIDVPTDEDGEPVYGVVEEEQRDVSGNGNEDTTGEYDGDYYNRGSNEQRSFGDGPGKGRFVDETTNVARGSLGISWGADDADLDDKADFGTVASLGNRSVSFVIPESEGEGDGVGAAARSVSPVLTSGGVPLVYEYSADGKTLTAYRSYGESVSAGDTENVSAKMLDNSRVFQVVLDDNGAGSYTFTLLRPLDHADGAGENSLKLDFQFTATDSDGDTTGPATISIIVVDDVPVLSGCDLVFTIDEDDIKTALSTGTSPNDTARWDDSYTGNPNLGNDSGPAYIKGSLESLVKPGADGPVSFSFVKGADATAALSTLTALGLSSHGDALSYRITGETLQAYVAGSEGEGERVVFSLTLEQSGSFEFELHDQLDHDAPGDDFRERPTNSDENFDLQDKITGDVTNINFGALIEATDGDEDRISLDGAFSIKIRDDVPELSGKEENRLVDEDDIKNGQSSGNFPNDGNGDGSFTGSSNSNGNGPANISGSLANLIKGGADDTVKFSFINENTARATLDRLGLKSEGAELSYDIRDGVLYAFDNAGSQKGESYDPDNGDRLVFTLTLSEDGSYTFELVDQLDHDKPYSGANENTDLQDNVFGDVEAIDFGSIIKATDFDGDSVVLKDAFSITVKDDVPVLSGTKEDRIIDEDDISTMGMSQPGESLGTSPNDGASEDQSYTDSPSNNQPGPAYISGSLANLVRGGADDPITFSFINETAIRNQLSLLGLSSKGSTLSYDLQPNGVLYAFDNKGPYTDENYDKNNDRLVFSLKLNSDGSYEFRLFDQLDHDRPFDDKGDGNGIADENFDLRDGSYSEDVTAINFGKLITATDYDGDTISLDGAFSIKVRDDVPTAVARNTEETLIVDESDRPQNDDTGYSLDVFRNVDSKGTDLNMWAQFAQQSNFVTSTINGGADDDVRIEWDLKINGGNGTASGLFTTDGRSIVLFLEGGLIVGRYDRANDGNTDVDSSDPAAFALHLSDNGTLSMVQYVSIKHDDAADHDENDDANDNNLSTVVQSLTGKLNAVLTVTDYDGDKAVSEVSVGDRIQFQDDGPSVKPYDVNTMRIISDDDTVVGRNGNPGFGSSTADGSFTDSKEYNKTGTLQFSAGADGATVAWNLADISVLSGATGITFDVNSSGTLLIFQNQGGSTVQIAQVTLNAATGSYVYTQTANLLHTAGSDENEAEFKLGFKVTDGDGDTADGKLTLLIDDDTPVVKPYDINTMRIISDDDTVAGRNGNPGFGSNATDGSGSDSQEYNKTGTLQFSAGADGATVAWNLDNISVLSGATGITFDVNSSGTLLIFQNQGGSTVQIAQVTLNAATGSYVYTQTANLLHTAGGAENEAEFKLGFTVTDGDGDKADGKLTLLIDDDTPTLVSAPTTGLTLNEDDLPLGNDDGPAKEGLSATGNLSISLGADGGSVALSAPNANWDPVYKTLTATDWSWKITLNSNGTYKFDLLKKTLEHGPGDDLENTLSVNVTYTATDGDGDIESGSFEIKIVDDVPIAVGESATVREAAPVVGGNLILAFDVSGSMDEDAVTNGRFESKLDVAKAAALNMLANSDAASVLIVTFNDSARSSIWMSKADAIAYINGQIPNEAGGTNYDSAIQAIMTSAKPASTVYFFSDGNAGGGSYALDDAETVAWQNFVNSNGMTSYAVGVGSGLNANNPDLSDVAHPGNPIVITTADDAALLATVVPTPQMPSTASGFVLENDSFGADGGQIQSIVVDGVTHTWDGNEANKVLNVTTALGGSLMFNFKTGAWSYAAPSELVSDTAETFTYKLVDGDGDTKTADLVLNLKAVNDGPVNTVPASLNAFEDTELAIAGVQINDVDAGNGSLTVKLEVQEGELKIGSTVGSTITLTGTVAEINAALLGLKYKGDLNFNGADQLKITTTDNGNTGIGGAKSDVDTVAINVAAVNDAPVLTPDAREIEFRENGSPVDLFRSVDLQDSDNPENFNGGSVEISLGNTAVSGDQLVLNDDDFRVSGTNVQIWTGWSTGWSTIGTIVNGGFGQTTVKIDLGFGATEERIEELLEAVAFRSTSENPTDATRTVTVTFNDGGNIGGGPLSDSSVISVEVKPVNDAPIFTGGDDRYFTIDENSAAVGTVAATDVDGGTLTYSILQSNDTDWSKFKIDQATGALSFKTAPDFEDPTDQNENNKYWVEVQVSDGRGGFDRQMIEIDVKNVNEKPTDINLSAASVAENVAGATIGRLSTVDPDFGNTHTYTVSDERFQVVGGQLRLKPGVSLNYEAEQTVDVTVTTKDGGNLTHQETFKIIVQDGVDKQTGSSSAETITGTAGPDVLEGKGGNDTLIGGNGDDTLIGGTGADTMTGGAGQDRFEIQAGDSTPATSGSSGSSNGTVSGFDVISDWGSGGTNDKLVMPVAVAKAFAGSWVDGADSTLTVGGDTVESHRVNSDTGIVTFFGTDSGSNPLSITTTGGLAAVVQYLMATDIGSSGATIAFTGMGNTYVYQQTTGNSGGTLVQLSGVALADIYTSGGLVSAIDPIILDLDKNGFALSSIDNGVTFDINADGKGDQIAWTSDDGILAFDVDGNGLIDNGSEIFTPDFNGGKFASGVAALASLDSNKDGKIDASDDAFSKLQVWVDADNDGVSDEGELSSLSANGVASISLTTDQTGGEEDGQTVFAEGEFTFADGSTGNFLEVGFDTIFGSDNDGLTLHGGMGEVVMTGSAGADTFVFDGTALDELDVADVITDFSTEEGDVLDVTALLDSLLGEQPDATVETHLRATVDEGNTTVSVQTAQDTWKDVVVLQNHDTAIKVLFDDKHAVVTPHD
jgi:T1SS-143 domain-containing protein